MNESDTFPLLALEPVHDARHTWVALHWLATRPFDSAVLERLLVDCSLAGILDTLPCIVPANPLAIDASLANRLPAGRLILTFPWQIGAESKHHEALRALTKAGFGLMASGLPAQGSQLAPEIKAIAVPCPGSIAPEHLVRLLIERPGPHLALGTTDKVCPGFCRFHWLSGHFAGMTSPAVKGDPATRSQLLRLLDLITADAELAELETVFKQDANLSYKLLKLVNSVTFMPGRRIENFTQALVMLGRHQLLRWVTLLLFAQPVGGGGVNPLLPLAALRGRLLEGLARQQGMRHDACDQAFMTGMFSLLDRLFGQPLAEILAPLNLADDIAQALLARHGPFGRFLKMVDTAEQGDFPALTESLAQLGIDRETWAALLIDAAGWAVWVGRGSGEKTHDWTAARQA